MDKRDLALIEEYRKTNYDLDKLVSDHEELEKEIVKMEAYRILNTEEEKKLHAFKKKKLQGRDKIERIMSTLR